MSAIALENKTILVTGAAGFIGSNLVKRICEEVPSAKVVGIDSVNDYYDVALKEFRLNELSKYESFTFIKGNIANKVYGADGCQITTEAAAEILAEIEKLDIFDDVKRISFEEGFEAGKISYISEEVYTAFVEAVKKESVLGDTQVNKDVAIVYSPLNL